MEASEQIDRFSEFFDTSYNAELAEAIRKGKNHLDVDFSLLSKFDPELAGLLLDMPEEVVKAAELAVEQMETIKDVKNFRIRYFNLPESQKMLIRHIRAKHLGRLFYYEGVVRQKSEVRPQVTSVKFECPSCGNVIHVLQLDKKMREPSSCGCGRKGKFKMLDKELIDAQMLVLEESAEDIEGGEQPKRMNIFLKEDLVSPLTEKRTNPGSKVTVTGFVKEVPLIGKDGGKLTRYDLMIMANYIGGVQEDYYEVEISEEEEEKIKALASNPKVYELISQSIAPSIFGYDKIKEAIALQLVGGVKKTRSDGAISRGDMHVLLIGDPGAGKSQLLKRAARIAPKARYVSGKGVSGAGLTASVVKDEFLNGWSLEAGALPLANKGFCMIDELDKMSSEDTSAMHEALEGQTITISKANIQATLRAETTVLAAANPKFGRFDPYDVIAKQIDLPPALINRFDLIFAIKDLPESKKDEMMANHILHLHKDPDMHEPEIDTDLLKKFISYARQKSKPRLSEEAITEIKRYYVDIRNREENEEAAMRSVPISARQLEALVRLAEGYAKIRLGEEVTEKDARKAIDLLHYCLSQIGVDPETGKIDIDRIATGITASQRSHIITIKDIIDKLENEGNKSIKIQEIIKRAKEKGIKAETVDETIEKLKRTGDIFEPRRGEIQKI